MSPRRARDLADLLDRAAEVLVRGSNEGVIVEISPAVTAQLGWRPAEMVGRPFADFVHPDDLSHVRDAQADLMAGRRAQLEARLRTVQGGYVRVAISIRPEVDGAGTVIGRVGGWTSLEPGPAASEPLGDRVLRLLAEHTSEVLTARHHRPPANTTGEYASVSMRLAPLADPSGQLIGVVVSARDVHDLFAARERSREHRRRTAGRDRPHEPADLLRRAAGHRSCRRGRERGGACFDGDTLTDDDARSLFEPYAGSTPRRIADFGLADLHGAVLQNGGFVTVDAAALHTVISVHLPAVT